MLILGEHYYIIEKEWEFQYRYSFNYLYSEVIPARFMRDIRSGVFKEIFPRFLFTRMYLFIEIVTRNMALKLNMKSSQLSHHLRFLRYHACASLFSRRSIILLNIART